MSAGYTGKPLHLIGPEVFPAYVCMLRKVLVIVLPIVAVAIALGSLVADRSLGSVIGGTVWSTFNVAVHICFWTTLVWVLVERNSAPEDVQANLAAEWTPDDLPEPPREGGFPLSDLVASLVFIGVAIAFLVGQHFWSWFDRADGAAIPILDPALWSGWLPLLIAILLAEAGFELVKHRAGHWTTPLAAANTLLNLAFALPVWFLAGRDLLLNPDFVTELDSTWESFDPQHINTIVIVTVVVVAAWSIVDGWRKARSTAA